MAPHHLTWNLAWMLGGLMAACPSAIAENPTKAVSDKRLHHSNKPATTPASETNAELTLEGAVAEVGAVHGSVVTPWGGGIGRLRMHVGGQRVYVDVEGHFTVENVPAIYDITITEWNNRQATAYHGLTRRDPVLTHLPEKYIDEGFRAESTLAKLAPDTGRIAGKVEVLKARPATGSNPPRDAESLTFSYIAPNYYPPPRPPGAIYLGSCATDGAFDCELPDLSSLNGEYCMAVGESLSKLRAMQCGGKIGMKNFSIPPQPSAPHIITDDGHGDTTIAWTVPNGGVGRVFELNLGDARDGVSGRLYTAARSVSWQQVAALGVDFRRGDPRLRGVKVTALLPYTSIDDLTSGRGPMAMGTSWRRVESDEVVLPLPADFKVAPPAPRPPNFNPHDRRSVPACLSPDKVKSIRVGKLGPSMANTRVTVRGPLGLGGGVCLDDLSSQADWQGHCSANWMIVDPDNPKLGVLLCRAEELDPLRTSAGHDLRQLAGIEFMAAGVLVVQPSYSRSTRERKCILDEVTVCAVAQASTP